MRLSPCFALLRRMAVYKRLARRRHTMVFHNPTRKVPDVEFEGGFLSKRALLRGGYLYELIHKQGRRMALGVQSALLLPGARCDS